MDKKSSYVGTGSIFGLLVGMIIGLIFFDQIALGGAFGMCFGIIISAIVQGYEKRKSSSR